MRSAGIKLLSTVSRKFIFFWLTVGILYSLIFILPGFAANPASGLHGFLILGGQFVIVASASIALIGLIAVNRFIFAVTFPVLTLLSVAVTYFSVTMGATLTPAVIELMMVTDMRTCATVFSPLLIILVLSSLLASAGVAYWRYRYVKLSSPAVWALSFATVVALPTVLIPRLKAPVSARLPFNIWYVCTDYYRNRTVASENRTTFNNIPATAADNTPDIILVIGESLRPDHLGINGYHRNTTPMLSTDSNLVSLPYVTTEPCYTHLSVPHIVTRADSINPIRAFEEEGVSKLFSKAGYRTAWLANQDASDTYIYFMHETDTLIYTNAARSMYDYGKWLDTDLLEPVSKELKTSGRPHFMILHTIGSHWWYRSHYPDSLAKFQPEINSRVLSELTHQQLINSYDNTILATDLFLHSLISMLAERNALLIFISDHGEALGEAGEYLHAKVTPPLHHTACLVWYSDTYASKHPDKTDALRNNEDRRHSTDIIFHSLLDGAGISTAPLDTTLSLFRQ